MYSTQKPSLTEESSAQAPCKTPLILSANSAFTLFQRHAPAKKVEQTICTTDLSSIPVCITNDDPVSKI